ncbi:alpha/beta hydrolase [Gordonia sp. HY442]|uniref:alpha/beta hydrolase n=1 Tax=Gordonia zhenghanii TaxID=2911516 RepID=UPI001F1F0FCB|nr:alpha/beta hydrolase [Gordonia zhenghanii]MCF8606508.1 alpha/beta hydrolase [Gordonia zhenghanii]
MASTVENPDASMRYGSNASNIADIFEPVEATDSLVLLLHGGFWNETDRIRTWDAGHALAAAGHLTASVGYRHGPGSWSSAFDDVIAAIDQIQLSGREWTVGHEAPRKITLVGHSAGGQLALWAASRSSLPAGSRWKTDDLQATAVVALAPIADLARAAELGIGDAAVQRFLGGAPSDVPDAYAAADPAELSPSIPVRVLHGSDDDLVPVELSKRYAERAGAQVALDVVDGVGNAEWGDPSSDAWQRVIAAIGQVTG